MKKKIFILQYSRPTNTRICTSDWLEYTKKILAVSIDDAVERFNRTCKGTWYILDCYPK